VIVLFLLLYLPLKLSVFKGDDVFGLFHYGGGWIHLIFPRQWVEPMKVFLLGLFTLGTGPSQSFRRWLIPYVTILGPKDKAFQRIQVLWDFSIRRRNFWLHHNLQPVVLRVWGLLKLFNQLETMESSRKMPVWMSWLEGVITPYAVVRETVLVSWELLVRFSLFRDWLPEHESAGLAEAKFQPKPPYNSPHLHFWEPSLFFYMLGHPSDCHRHRDWLYAQFIWNRVKWKPKYFHQFTLAFTNYRVIWSGHFFWFQKNDSQVKYF